MPTLAVVKDGASFIGTAQLRGRESDFCPSTFVACFVYQGLGIDLMLLDRLHRREFLAQQRGEVGRFALGDGCLRCRVWNPALDFIFFISQPRIPGRAWTSPTFIVSTTAVAVQYVFYVAFRHGQQITAD